MQAPINQEALAEKWAPLLDYEGLDPIKDNHRRMVTAVLLENQEQTQREERAFLSEQPTVTTGSSGATAGFSAGATAGGPVAGFDPVLISLIRRSMPNLVAYDLAGVQPMSGPTGLIFAMRSRFTNQVELRHCSTNQTQHSLHSTLTVAQTYLLVTHRMKVLQLAQQLVSVQQVVYKHQTLLP